MTGLPARLLVALALTLPGLPAGAAESAHRPMAEMHGDCGNYAWDLTAELAAWEGADTALAAALQPGEAPDAVPLSPLAIALRPQGEVRFAAPPGRDSDGERFAGLLAFTATQDGNLRVSAGGPVWIDVVLAGGLVKESGFEMQTQCERIFKSVAFPVTRGQRLLLQLSGSKTAAVRLLLSYAP